MPLTPQDIVRKEFREALRGYNQADVDLFLDEVVEEFTRVAEENQRMKVRIAALQQEVARMREARGSAAAAPPTEASGADAARLEAEVRTRLRRFLEEQIRLLDVAAPSAAGSTADRMAREIAAASDEEAARPEEPPGTPSREPFWAGE